MNTIFSIVIPLYNKEQSIKKTIESVLNQTYQNFELLIVNDGSTDSSVEIVSAIKDKRIKIINKENGGVSSARNLGIIASTNCYIAFLDGDDLWLNNYLEEFNNLIIDYPNNVIYGSNYFIKLNENCIEELNFINTGFRGVFSNYFKIAQKNWLFHSSAIIINNKILNSEVLFDERQTMGEDFDFWFQVVEKGNVAYINKPLVIYNNDDPNRAMKKKHQITKNYIFYSKKFKDLENKNKDFNKLINRIRTQKLPELFINTDATDAELKKVLLLIDYKYLEKKYFIFSKLPYFFKKKIIYLIYKNKFNR
jgi:glycosyltransferase involved in cell wall biosynthesis